MLSTTHSEKGNHFKQVIEIYLFINPIGSVCYQAEKGVMDFIQSCEEKVHFHFIPVHNFKTFSDYMKALELPAKDLNLRNELFSQTYEACLAYSAACMQGKKKGRVFLMAMQQALTIDNLPFSQKLLQQIAYESNLDIPMFLEDKKSEFAKAAFEADQKIAREMNILTTPSCVVFSDQHKDHGLLIEEYITVDLLEKLCVQGSEVYESNPIAIASNQLPAVKKNHLHVL